MAGRPLASWFWQDIRESLLAQPVKTSLTFMAVGVGMLALTILLAILAGLEKRAQRQVSEIGADVLVVASATGAAGLDARMVDQLRQLAPGSLCAGVRHAALVDVVPDVTVQALAAGEDFPLIRGWELDAGRWLDRHDMDHAAMNAVISRALADRLFLQPGDVLALRESLFKVVGIVRGSGSLPGQGPAGGSGAGDLFLWAPPAAPVWWVSQASVAMFDAVHLKNRTYARLDELAARVRRDLGGGAVGDTGKWSIITPDSLVASTRAMMKTVRMVYGSVAALCLVLGGATLSSLMMVNIQQRITEIGLRMAIGASWRDIFAMFVCEGLITTVAAGLLGQGMGLGLVYFLKDSMELPVAFHVRILVLPLMVSVLLGVVFSWYPARMAASLTPADALRSE